VAEGRAFAHILTGANAGQVWELPSLGNLSFENVVANPLGQDLTVVAGLDDTSNQGQVYFYLGEKQATGNAIEMAGLSGGSLFGVKVGGAQVEVGALADPTTSGFALDANGEGSFTLVDLGDVAAMTGAEINTASHDAGVTEWLRPEDGAWSLDGTTFYFVTTANLTGASRLWALDFDDPSNPAAGGTVKMLLDGSEGQVMMDNMTVSDNGTILIQEDPGSANRLAAIWSYDPETDTLTKIAEHDALYTVDNGQSEFITTNEESSGIIDVSAIFAGEPGYSDSEFGYFLVADQIHFDVASPTSQVEMGQLTLMAVPEVFA